MKKQTIVNNVCSTFFREASNGLVSAICQCKWWNKWRDCSRYFAFH